MLSDVNLIVDPRERLGIIGENGIGKSTLLRLMGGVEAPDVGSVSTPQHLDMLRQEVQFPPTATVGALLEDALSGVRAIEHELQDAAVALGSDSISGDHYARAPDAAEGAEVWSADSRRDEILAGLGVEGIGLDRRLSEVSGGQRSRFALAALLLSRAAAFLLDEPTNHLSLSLATELEDALGGYPGAVVVASHDRWLRRRWTGAHLELRAWTPSASLPSIRG